MIRARPAGSAPQRAALFNHQGLRRKFPGAVPGLIHGGDFHGR